jgi:hypothetical protein
MDIIVDTINNTFSNDLFRLLLIILTGIFASYTLRPIPKWLDNLFNTSYILKFIIIIIIGILVVYPINKSKLINVILVSLIILILFEIFRNIDN